MRHALVMLIAGLCAASSLEEMTVPIEGMRLTDLRDMFEEAHNGHRHEAIDIMEPRGTPIHAVVSGKIVKLFLSKAGGITIYEFDQEGAYCYYYAHLDRYAESVKEGEQVKAGDVIGYVGSTGNASADAPHLHFAVTKLSPEKQWWKGESVNPYTGLVEAVRRRGGR